MSDSFSFLEGRGYLVKVSGGSSSSIFSVLGLPTGGQGDSMILIDDINVGAKVIVAPKDALNDKHVLYVFGSTFELVTITGTIYMKNCSNKSGIQAITNFYDSNKVSKKLNTVNVSIAKEFKSAVYLVDIKFGLANAQLNTILFTLVGLSKPRK